MNLETKIHLNKFKPRSFQLPLIRAFEEQKKRKLIAVWPRRAGKDYCVWNLLIRYALDHVGIYHYIFPTYALGKKSLWDTIAYDGTRFLHMIPPELVKSTNEVEMKIKLHNGSLIQVVGSKDIDNLRGTNATGMVFSEYAHQSPEAYQVLSPILNANPNSWVFFVSTPFGRNHLYHLYEVAKINPDHFFLSYLTLEDTQHVTVEDIENDVKFGLITKDMVQQEYYCNWDRGIEGTILGKYMNDMRLDNRIGLVPWEPSFKVHSAWDLGIRDAMTVIMFQTIGNSIRIIDCYENTGYGLEHYIKVLEQKPYKWGRHIAPHDISVRELCTGLSRWEVARQLGISFVIAPDLSKEDGIQAMRSITSRVWIDERKCINLIRALESYHREYDDERKVYKSTPEHDWSCHFADAFRYLAVSVHKTYDGLTAEELDKRFAQAQYGSEAQMPRFFRDNNG